MRSRLLVSHFLRRFVDNDLLSPHADRHVIMSFGCAMLATASLFVTVFIAMKYQAPFESAGHAAVSSLDDKFLYFAWSMVIMTLLAVVEWNALALDARDTLILGPLPIPRSMIVKTKITAIVLLATGFALMVNAVPALLYSWALCARLPIGVLPVMKLVAAHGAIAMLSGGFGFMAVLSLREGMHAVAGERWFDRVSPLAHASLMVLSLTTALLLPGRSQEIASWLAQNGRGPYLTPPAWFVGLHEALAGGVIEHLPRVQLPRRVQLPNRVLLVDNKATVLYRSLHPIFSSLAGVAVLASLVVCVVAMAAFAWSSRRFPMPAQRPAPSSRTLRRALLWLATHVVVRRPAAQAGFFFALQSLSQNTPHRFSMAASVAVALALIVVILGGHAGDQTGAVSTVPLLILSLQTLCLAALIIGFRMVVRVPAEPRANWIFRLAWSGDERPFLSGVKRAGLLLVAAPAISLFWPWYVFALGPQMASANAVVGFLFALLLTEVLFLGFRQLPFVSAYAPPEHLKSLAGFYLLALLYVVFVLGRIEQRALATTAGTVMLIVSLTVLLVGLRAVDVSQRRTRVTIDLDEMPSSATQRLDLVR